MAQDEAEATRGRPPPHHEHHHRNIQGGAARAAVFGFSDGLVSNVALILGVAGADPAPSVVRLAGLAGLLAGAFSMAAGEYVSMRAQAELLGRELELERIEIARRPEHERRELAAIYRSRGVEADVADELAAGMMRTPDMALQTHAREELGIDPEELGSPVKAAVSSFFTFGVGALTPLAPWFFTEGGAATITSLVVGAVMAMGAGIALARATDRPWPWPAFRQLLIAVAAASFTFTVGKLVGVGAEAVAGG